LCYNTVIFYVEELLVPKPNLSGWGLSLISYPKCLFTNLRTCPHLESVLCTWSSVSQHHIAWRAYLKLGASCFKCMKQRIVWTGSEVEFKMKITWRSAAALEFKCLTVKCKVKYTFRSDIVINQEIVEQFNKYIISYDEIQLINPLKTKRRLLYLKTQSIPCSEYFSSQIWKPVGLCCKWYKSLFVLR
jgi:hypothetical protein